MAELQARIASQFPGKTWSDVHNSPLLVSALLPKIAHEFYPDLFTTPTAFTADMKGWTKSQDQQIQEMIDIVRAKRGKRNILFIVDEVGQYVASRDNLILNLDGLAKNLKRLGDGKVWIIATAQQTLTEDDPRAALNSDKLYKLKDRFPIQIDLESSDIKENCYRRLIGKSPAGETALGKLFDAHGQALRHHTKLQDAKYYDTDFSRASFTNLYPFLPAHFDILLHLLGALAKSTGGIGLRSAIKIIQDVLKGEGGAMAMADQPVGWLATTVTLYDELEKDIRRAFPSVHQSVGKVQIRFPDAPLHQDIAKSLAVLHILDNLPVTVHNVASLMQPSVTAPSRLDTVRKAVEDLLNDVHVPLGEKDGSLVFLSDRLRDIEQERGAIALRTVDVKRIFNETLGESFEPLPRVSLHGTLTVATGLNAQTGSAVTSLAGATNTSQTLVELVPASDYEPPKIGCWTTRAAGRVATSSGCWPAPTPISTTWPTRSTAASESPSCTATSPTRRSRTTAPASSTAPPSWPPSCGARSSRPCNPAPSSSAARPRRYPPWTGTCWRRPGSSWWTWPTRCSTATWRHRCAWLPTPPSGSSRSPTPRPLPADWTPWAWCGPWRGARRSRPTTRR